MMCDMCLKSRSTKVTLVDHNAEMDLCASCIEALRRECDVEVIEG